MPQLNPDPWFLIWLSTWLIFLLAIPSMVMQFKPYNSITTNMAPKTLNHWSWPW
uniref:ATP synthase complex subunit 8 n=1 Tax=Cynoglossus trigrammus TaxID=1572597 RepID=A0A0B5A5U7_9PLEU|nr:ATP synthase subunit 8 [Cynoglossus trigrammus]